MYQIINSNILDFKTDQKYHAIISDPPYGLAFMNKKWDNFRTPLDYQKWVTEWSSHLMQFLYPGAICMFFGGTRTYHRLATGLEDAGYEIFDSMIWCYGSGFPKSYNISKGIDKSLGLEREIVKEHHSFSGGFGNMSKVNKDQGYRPNDYYKESGNDFSITKPNSNLAHTWNGYGTALKPAYETIVLCRKPLEKGGYVNSALKYGTSGLNIDGGRIESNENLTRDCLGLASSVHEGYKRPYHEIAEKTVYGSTNGRFPANFGLICDCECEPCECVEQELDRQSGISKSVKNNVSDNRLNDGNSIFLDGVRNPENSYSDIGGASRFFYTAKASSKERELGLEDIEITNGLTISGGGGLNSDKSDAYQARKSDRRNTHPTVKPIKLIEYLAKLALPPIENPSILIPFSGVGSEMIGCHLAGWKNITGIEVDENYVEIANKRLEHWSKYDNYKDALSNKTLIK